MSEIDAAEQRVVEVVVESIATGGDGVARLGDGRVLFLPFAAPGDRVRARLDRVRGNFASGRIEAVLSAGAGRAQPRCPAYGRCGGCSWQHLDYPTQLEAKREILRDAIERVGKLPLPANAQVHGSPPYGYRIRARLLHQPREGRVGYRERASHRLCAVDACPVLAPGLEAALRDPALTRPLSSQARATPELELELLLDREQKVRVTRLAGDSRPEPGSPPVDLDTPGGAMRVSPGVFAQANGPMLATFVERVIARACAGVPARAVELYAGAGLFTIALAPHVRGLIAVESFGPAVADLTANLRRHGLEHVEPVRAEALPWLRQPMPPLTTAPDLVLLDPPRSGLGERASRDLAGLRAGRIVYVSCDPVTLARDLRVLCDRGYCLDGVEGFDCFPQTPHLEAMAWLTLAPEAAGGRSRDVAPPC